MLGLCRLNIDMRFSSLTEAVHFIMDPPLDQVLPSHLIVVKLAGGGVRNIRLFAYIPL